MNVADMESYNTESIQATVDEIVGDTWYWFPIRHHSPASAWHLKNAIQDRQPKVVFIEGPFEANHLIPQLLDKDTKPPVAIYSSFEDTNNEFKLAGIASPNDDIPPRWACWYPFCEYSPEYIALETARQMGIPTHFIDLPHFARLKAEIDFHRSDRTDDAEDADGPNDKNRESEASQNYDAEQLIVESTFYQRLAAAGGFKNWDEAWDTLFEFRDFENYEDFRLEMLRFCAAARKTSHRNDMMLNETMDRERFMMQSIREYLAKHSIAGKDVLIVCGGFHTALDRSDKRPHSEIPSGTTYTTIVPYSWFRIADISGYGAGNRAPRFYQQFWETLSDDRKGLVSHYTVAVLKAARKLGESVSSADAISITQHARMLSALRHRPRPILDDLHDAIITCCCKGNPGEQGINLQRAIDQIDIGDRIGKVSEKAPRLPIVSDFYHQMQRLELSEYTSKEKLSRIELDKRAPIEFERSALLHRLFFIKVPFCQLTETPDSEFDTGLIFRERWGLKWSPEVESKLIELNLHGDSVESAAVNLLRKHFIEQLGNAAEITSTLVKATQMNLPNLIERVFGLAMDAIEDDQRFPSLAAAYRNLKVLDQYALHNEDRREKIAEMLQRSFYRACFAMQEIVSAPDDQHPSIVDGLTALGDDVLKQNVAEDQLDLYSKSVANACEETTVPFLRGALIGLSVELKIEPYETVIEEITGFARASQEEMAQAGEFIHGVISVSRTSIMTGSNKLVSAIDELIRASEWEVFMVILPKLRAAMELLHGRHRQTLSERVAEHYGLRDSQTLRQLEVSVEAAAEIVEIDKIVADIMSKWSFAND